MSQFSIQKGPSKHDLVHSLYTGWPIEVETDGGIFMLIIEDVHLVKSNCLDTLGFNGHTLEGNVITGMVAVNQNAAGCGKGILVIGNNHDKNIIQQAAS